MILTLAVTAHNEEKYIERCLNSLINGLSNCMNDVEIIVSVNNSTDNTLSIAKKYCEKYKNIFVYETSKPGPSVARNCALDHANGDYIYFVDGDDYVDGKIELLVNYLKKNSEIDFIQFTYNIYKNDKLFRLFPCKTKYFDKKLTRKAFLKNFKLNTAFSSSSSRAISMKLINKYNLRYNEDFFQMEDMEFGIRACALSQSLMYANLCFYYYETKHDGSLTKTIDTKRAIQGYKAALESMNFVDNSDLGRREKIVLKKFASLLCFSLTRAIKYMDKSNQDEVICFLNKNLKLLSYPDAISTVLFYMFMKIFGIKAALKFV